MPAALTAPTISAVAPANPGRPSRRWLAVAALVLVIAAIGAWVLRPRGDALFPMSSGAGTLLAFSIPESDLESWHRRLLMLRIPVLEGPGHAGGPPRHVRLADPEGNVVEFFAAT